MRPLHRILAPPDRPSWEPESTRPDRLRRVLPFLGLLGAALALVALPPGEPGRFGGLALAALGFGCCGALIVLMPWERLPDWPRLGLVALFCSQVAVVRDATGGGRSGFAAILLLAVVWQAVYGSRTHMLATVAMASATVAVPIVAIGGDRYPTTEWRKALLLLLVDTVVGLVVQQLVQQVRRERWVVGQVAGIGRGPADRDARRELCAATLDITGADAVVLFETRGDAVRVTGSAGVDLPDITLEPEWVPDVVRRAITTGHRIHVADTEALTDHNTDASTAMGVRSWVHQPAGVVAGTTTVVLSVAWATPRPRVPTTADQALPLLAIEAATAVDRAELVGRLDALTRQDPLTGLVNRRGWDDHLAREISRCARSGRPLSVAVLDLDRFKRFNDAHGHLVGDQLLKGAASAWAGALRASDVLARWGGEEFAVLMPETAPPEAEAVLARMAASTPMGQTFSAGVVTVTTAVDPTDLMAAADEAVYRAKDAGRNRIEAAAAPAERSVAVPSSPAAIDR